jgi:biopolymer transport protein ExbB/TolQ
MPAVSRISSFCDWLLRLPLLWGCLAYLGFEVLLSSSFFNSPLLVRYCIGHPVERIEVALGFIGLAALIIRLLWLSGEFGSLRCQLLQPVPTGGQPASSAGDLLIELSLLPRRLQKTYLVRRLSDAIEHIRRKDSADNLESHLRHLENADLDRVSSGYSLIRIVIWAIPILGFLGTVIGITDGITELNPQALEESMPKVVAGLGVAFDTTALALALSMVLMFTKFCAERLEDRLLSGVNHRADQELIGRFQTDGSSNDPNVAAIRRMSEQVIRAVETVTAKQIQLWKSTIDETHQQWSLVSSATGQVLEESLAKSLREHAVSLAQSHHSHLQVLDQSVGRQVEALNEGIARHAQEVSRGSGQMIGQLRDGLEKMAELLVEALQKHGELLTSAEEDLARENRKHLSEVEAALGEAMVVAADRQEKLIRRSEELLREMQEALVEAAGATIEHQEQLVKQGEVLLQVVDATGQVKKLEETLNSNLSSLGRAHNFEETLLSLSAAIQLLSARVGREPASRTMIEVDPNSRKSQAA